MTFGLHLLGHEAVEAGAPPPKPHWSVSAAPVSMDEHVEVTWDMRARGVRFINGLDMGMAARPVRRVVGERARVREVVRLLALAGAGRLDRRVGGGDAARPRDRRDPVRGSVADLMSVAGDPAVDIARPGRRGGRGPERADR